MKRISLLLIFLFVFDVYFCSDIKIVKLTDRDEKVIKNSEYALSQKLYLNSVEAKQMKDNKVFLTSIYDPDFVGSIYHDTTKYFREYNSEVKDLIMNQTHRERLEMLHKKEQKKALLSLVPNVFSVATMAFSSGNLIRTIIAVSGSVLNSTASYLISGGIRNRRKKSRKI